MDYAGIYKAIKEFFMDLIHAVSQYRKIRSENQNLKDRNGYLESKNKEYLNANKMRFIVKRSYIRKESYDWKLFLESTLFGVSMLENFQVLNTKVFFDISGDSKEHLFSDQEILEGKIEGNDYFIRRSANLSTEEIQKIFEKDSYLRITSATFRTNFGEFNFNECIPTVILNKRLLKMDENENFSLQSV